MLLIFRATLGLDLFPKVIKISVLVFKIWSLAHTVYFHFNLPVPEPYSYKIYNHVIFETQTSKVLMNSNKNKSSYLNSGPCLKDRQTCSTWIISFGTDEKSATLNLM